MQINKTLFHIPSQWDAAPRPTLEMTLYTELWSRLWFCARWGKFHTATHKSQIPHPERYSQLPSDFSSATHSRQQHSCQAWHPWLKSKMLLILSCKILFRESYVFWQLRIFTEMWNPKAGKLLLAPQVQRTFTAGSRFCNNIKTQWWEGS